jgi:site-specific recombinase XerC
MTTLDFSAELDMPRGPLAPDEAELAAVAFLARYSGRTLDAYRHDLRNLFQWAADHGLAVLEATRAHLELYRVSMEERGLAASTIDRRLSTACGFYRFAHIDGRITSNPTQPSTFAVRRSIRPSGADWTGASSAGSSSPPNASTTPTQP